MFSSFGFLFKNAIILIESYINRGDRMKLIVNIISDTSGYATEQIVKVSFSQFNVETITNIYSDIRDEKSLEDILNFIIETGDNFIIYHSFQDSKMNAYINKFCELNDISYVDLTGYSIKTISNKINIKPKILFLVNLYMNLTVLRL